jgi:hypothetical protein
VSLHLVEISSVCLPVCLSVCLYVCLSVCLSGSLSVYLSGSLSSLCLSVGLIVDPSVASLID